MDLPEKLTQEPKFISWKNNIIDSGCTIQNIEPLSLHENNRGELLFALLKATVATPENTMLPPIIFIRGDACMVVPLIKNCDTGEEKFLMIKQRRIGSGKVMLEFPAGMIDRALDKPSMIALKELEEETSLRIKPEQLRSLHPHPLYSSVGGCDERIYYYGCRVTCNAEQFQSFEGTKREQKDEDEHIHVTLRSKSEALTQIESLQVLLGLFLFEEQMGSSTV